MTLIYGCKCRSSTEINDERTEISKNNLYMLKGTCVTCNAKKKLKIHKKKYCQLLMKMRVMK